MKSLGIALGMMAAVVTAQAAELERAEPASVGLSAAKLAELKSQMNAVVEKGDRAGLVYAIARNGKLVALEALGKRNIERNLPMEPDTQFRIYSMTRAISGSAILTLIEDGKLSLDDPVAKYIPDVAKMKVLKSLQSGSAETEEQKTPLTVRHLFTYTSGLGYANAWPASLNLKQSEILHPDMSMEDGMKRLTQLPFLYQPGSKWYYGFSGDVLGRVAEVASGQPLNTLLKTRLLDKIGMKDTDFWITPEDAARHRLADVYGRTEAGAKLVNTTAQATPLSHFTRPGKLFSGGGGLVSTAPDYLRFAQMLLNGGTLDGQRVLKPETVKMMISQHTTPAQGAVYWYAPGQFTSVTGWMWGLAIGVRPQDAGPEVPGAPGDVGWSGLANTFFLVNPRLNVAAVVMSQYVGPNGNDLSALLRQGVVAAIEK